MKRNGISTPPGTQPQPVRRSTKHKRPEYGRELQEKRAARFDRWTPAKRERAKAMTPRLKGVANVR